jgi:mono/diheme cytochrome c family protein
MRRALWLLAIPGVLGAADDLVARGAVVYRNSCGVTYCHGPEGKPSRAPGLAGRGLDAVTIATTAASGIPNTSMPAFGSQLKPEDLMAVAAYIVSLGGSGGAASGAKPQPKLPADVKEGRALFFDATRTGNCGSCHELGGMGVPVSIALQDLRKARTSDLRGVTAAEIVTVKAPGERVFPAVVVEKSAVRLRVYDVSSRLPVLRTFRAADVSLTPGGSWKHADAASLYTDSELAAISRYLKWAAEQSQ